MGDLRNDARSLYSLGEKVKLTAKRETDFPYVAHYTRFQAQQRTVPSTFAKTCPSQDVE